MSFRQMQILAVQILANMSPHVSTFKGIFIATVMKAGKGKIVHIKDTTVTQRHVKVQILTNFHKFHLTA